MIGAMLFVTTACSNGSGNTDGMGNVSENTDESGAEVAMGRYLQTELKLPSESMTYLVATAQKPDGTIVIAAYSESTFATELYQSGQDREWHKIDTPWLKEDSGREIVDIKYDESGQLYVLYFMYPQSGYVPISHLARETEDGTLEEIDIDWHAIDDNGQGVRYTYESTDAGAAPESEPDGAAAELPTVSATPEDEAQEGSDSGQTQANEESTEAGDDEMIAVLNDDSAWPYPQGFIIGKDGDVIVYEAYRGFVRYGSDGSMKTVYGLDEAYYFNLLLSQDGTILVLEPSEKELIRLDYETGNIIERTAIDWPLPTPVNLIEGAEGTLYTAGSDGVYALQAGGMVWERIVEGDLTTLGLPSLFVDALYCDGEGGFILLQSGAASEFSFSQLHYSATTPTRPTHELTVYSLYESATIRQAAVSYQRSHPEVRVSVQTVFDEDSSATVNDAVRALNTEILAGKGPDVLVLDGLPIDSYIEKGVLADISDVIQPKVDSGELLANIAQSYAKDGTVYAVPARAQLLTLWGSEENLKNASSLKSLANWAEANPNQRALYLMNGSELIYQFYLACAPAWLDENGQIDSAALSDFLTDIKRLADTKKSGEFSVAKYEEEFRNEYGEMYGQNYEAVKEMAEGLGMWTMMRGETAFYSKNIEGMYDLMIAGALVKSTGGGTYTVMPGQAGRVYRPSGIVGVNANSAQPDMARELVLEVLSEDVQKTDLQDGWPVNEAALQYYITNRQSTVMVMSMSDSDLMLTAEWPEREVIEKLADTVRSVDSPTIIDAVLLEIVVEETTGFFEGSMTAQEAADKVAARAQIMLSE